MTDDGDIDIALRDYMPARFGLSGWQVQEANGHDAEAVSSGIRLANKDPRQALVAALSQEKRRLFDRCWRAICRTDGRRRWRLHRHKRLRRLWS
jgi:hypothetical protein